MSEDNKAPMIKLAGLWKGEGKDGAPFYSGKLGYGTRLMLFRNKFKKGDRDPDLVLYLAKSEERTGGQSADVSETPEDSEIPF
ncbi:hypothetical protein KKA53_05360 [Candidatus Dependentiae bacterium]|nr:hypothetical protein [Candidatus Dependentiae bacterium]